MKKYLVLLIGIGSLIFPLSVFASKSGLTIYSFQIAGESAYDEFITIKNDSSSPVALTGFTLSRKTKSASTWNTLFKFSTESIGPNQTITISHEKYTGVRDFVYSTSSYSLTAENSIAIIGPDKSIIDMVGYGEASGYEGTVLPAPTVKEVFTRFQDTDNNLADFISNTKTAAVDPNSSKILITELMPAPSEGSEWVELFNPTTQAVSLSGLKLCDAVGSIHCYYFPNDSILNPLEYKIYSQLDTKITLNNSGDWVELRDSADNLISDSGGDYGSADPGISLSLISNEFVWTKSATPSAINLFTSTIEEDEVATNTPKSKSSKVKKATVKVAPKSIQNTASEDDEEAVAGATSEIKDQNSGNMIAKSDNKLLGYSLIALAFILLLGYNLWDNKDGIRKFYDKISRRNL